jgi:tripartite ATP-independent transporter DctM subunit
VGTPLFCIVGAVSLYLFSHFAQVDISSCIIEMCRLANAPGITAIPLFIFAGYILATSNASVRLVNLSNALLGWMSGGPTIVTVVTCTIFTAMTGASAITIVAIGALMLPALIKEGYDKDFSMGLVTATGSIGFLFLPSLPIIIYGMIARTDITALFIAGTLPGILLIVAMSAYGVVYARRKDLPIIPFSTKSLWTSIWEAKWELPLPLVVVGGIYGGFITVGEAAAVTAMYVLISECIIYREIPLKKLLAISWESMIMVGALLVILGVALGLTNYLVDQHVPQQIMEFFKGHISSQFAFLLALNGILLVVGCLMDIFSAIIVVVPLITPTAIAFNVDPIHLGIIFLTTLGIGYLTPPVGMNLFVASLRFNVPILKLYKIVFPYFCIMMVALAIITYWPPLSLWLVDVLGQRLPLLEM